MTEREFITRGEAEQLMERAAERGARRVLQDIGVDAEGEWLETQKDLSHLRKMREGSEQIQRYATRFIVAAAVSGLVWAAWQGIKAALRVKGGGP